VDDLENEPAYKRKGVELNGDQNYSSGTDYSRYSVGSDELDRPEIKKNNSFLHDNVD
jgi:cell division protein FtsZ